MNKTVGMVAHVDAGKTTLLEQILYNTNTIREAGRVDNQNTFLDYHQIEKERGITVFSEQAVADYNNSTYFFVDTPGHVDFSTEMERAIRILDYAVIILSAVEGIEGHTETVWKLLKKYSIPTIFFINKLDRTGAQFEKVCDEVKEQFTKDLCLFTSPAYSVDKISINSLFNETVDDTLIEFAAERDDTIMEYYLEDTAIPSLTLLDSLQALFHNNQLYPCLCGMALNNIGVKELLHVLDKFAVTHYSPASDFEGTVYKIRHDQSGNKLTFIKVLAGQLNIKDSFTHILNDEEITEKVNEIRVYNGTKYTASSAIKAGELGAVTGLNHSYIGEGLGHYPDFKQFALVPTLKSKVIFDSSINSKEVLKCFTVLTEEDPSLDVDWVEALNEIHVNIMGIIQLEILKYVVKERFGIEVEFGTPEVLYKETITEETIGFGHFEPLKHYAEVILKLSPTKRNTGITFSSECSGDILHSRWQNLVKKSIIDGTKKGILTSSPLTDLHITLTEGKAHVKHTSGGDFRQATFRAIRQGIEQVDNILLEPYYAFSITVVQDLSGKVMSDINKMYGHFNPPITHGTKVTITGEVPVATAMNYPATLASFSKGKGVISLTYKGYGPCHNSEEVIHKIGYDPNKDPEYTSTSIFCSHGKAYSVLGKDIKY